MSAKSILPGPGARDRRLFAAELVTRPAGERADLLAAVDLVSGFSAWQSLRVHQGASAERARRVMARAIAALLR